MGGRIAGRISPGVSMSSSESEKGHLLKTHRDQMESTVLLWEDQEMITPTQTSEDVMQACPSDMIFLHELQLLDNTTENDGGAPTCTNDLNPLLAEKDISTKDQLCMLSDRSRFEYGNFQQDVGKSVPLVNTGEIRHDCRTHRE